MKVCETSYILEVPQRSKAAVIKTYRNTNYSRDIYVFMIAKIGWEVKIAKYYTVQCVFIAKLMGSSCFSNFNLSYG